MAATTDTDSDERQHGPGWLRQPLVRSTLRSAAAAAERGTLGRLIMAIGIVLAIAATVGLFLLLLIQPNGESPSATRDFYVNWHWLLLIGITIITFGYGVVLFAFAAMAKLAWTYEPNGILAWMIIGCELLLVTAFVIEAGMVAALTLLVDVVGNDALHTMHVAAFVIAAPLGSVGALYFLAVTMLSRRHSIFPRWLEWVGIYAGAVTLGAPFGIFTLSGALNAMNGVVAIGLGSIGYGAFLTLVPAWMTAQWLPAALRRLNAEAAL